MTAPKYTAFNSNSKLFRALFGSSLKVNESNPDNFFGISGMVERTPLQGITKYPIQQVDDCETIKCQTVQAEIEGWCADTQDHNNPQEPPCTTFEFETVDACSETVIRDHIGHDNSNQNIVISETVRLSNFFRSYWNSFFNENCMIYLAGMQGEIYLQRMSTTPQNGTGKQLSASDPTTFNDYMKELHAANEITAPSRLMTSWASSTEATDCDFLSPKVFKSMSNYLMTQNRRNDMPPLRKPKTSKMEMDESGHVRMAGKRSGWLWIIAPEIAEEIRKQIGNQVWARMQFNNAKENESLHSCIDTGEIGELDGIRIFKNDLLPSYKGGVNNDVPIARTLLLGSQALAFSFRNMCDDNDRESLAKLNNRKKKFSVTDDYNVPFDCRVEKRGKPKLHTMCKFGMKKVARKNHRQTGNKQVDNGLLALDVVYKENQQ